MAFPTTPTNGQQATVNGITYQYTSATNSWTRVAGIANTISATGNISASYFIGNGSQLTGITAGGGTLTFSNTAPSSASSGDVWIQANTAVQYVYFSDDTSNQWAEMEAYQSFSSTGGGAGTPAGSNTQIQFNDSGSFGASANLTFDKSTSSLTTTGNIAGGNLTTAGHVVATGNITAGNVAVTGNVTTNGAPLATTGKAIAMAIVFGF